MRFTNIIFTTKLLKNKVLKHKYLSSSVATNTSMLRLPCTFRGVSSLTDVAHAPYIADILTPYQINTHKICYKMIAILSGEFLATHLRGRYDRLS